MKEIIERIIAELKGVVELRYIDRNWGQLLVQNPAVNYPCALIDVQTVEFTALKKRILRAVGTIEVTVVIERLTPSSARSPRRGDSYLMYDLIERVMERLNFMTDDRTFSPLLLTSLQRQEASPSSEVFTLFYRTTIEVDGGRWRSMEVD